MGRTSILLLGCCLLVGGICAAVLLHSHLAIAPSELVSVGLAKPPLADEHRASVDGAEKNLPDKPVAAPARLEVPSPATTLAALAGRRIRLLDRDASPISQAKIVLLPLDGSVPDDATPEQARLLAIELETDAAGTALPPLLPSTQYLVHAEKPGMAWVDAKWSPPELPELVLTAPASKSLTGHVVTRDDAPIVTAIARRRRWGLGKSDPFERLCIDAFEEIVHCDERGRFAFAMVDDREQRVEVEAADYVSIFFTAIDPGSHLKAVLSRPARLHGKVTDASGRGLAGAWVRIVCTGVFPETSAREVRTDATGFFDVPDSPSGQIGIGYEVAGHASDRVDLTVEASGNVDASHVMQAAVTISGSVVGEDGTPIAKVTLDIDDETNGASVDRILTDAQGRFEIDKAALGRPYRIVVAPSALNLADRVDGVLGGSRGVTIVVDRAPLITGHVTFAGEPAPYIEVRTISLSRDVPDAVFYQTGETPYPLTLKDGAYRCYARTGLVDLQARAPGYAPVWVRNLTIPATGGTTTVDLHFTSEKLAVRVVDEATGKRVALARITALERCYSGNYVEGQGASTWTTSEDGEAMLEPFSPDTDALSISAAGLATALVRNPAQAARGTPPLLEVLLGVAGAIEGTVQVPYLAPETAVNVRARPMGFERGITTAVDHGGSYRLEGIPPGPVEVVLDDLFHATRFWSARPPARQVVVRAGETTRLDWRSVSGVTIEGEVQGFDGLAVIHAYGVDGEQVGGLMGGAHTDLEHRFRIPGLSPGRYLLLGRSGEPGKSLRIRHALDVSGDHPSVRVMLSVAEGHVQGTVRDQDRHPLARACVEMFAEAPRDALAEAVAITAADGSFWIGGIEAGTARLRITSQGFGTLERAHVRMPGDLGDLMLAPEAKLRVSATDDRGASIEGAAIRLESQPGEERRAFTSERGLCRFDALASGVWLIAATCAGHQPASTEIDLAPGEDARASLRLVRLGAIRVHAAGATGAPLGDAVIAVVTEHGEELVRAQPFRTNPQGVLVIRDVPAGSYTVMHEPEQLERDIVVRPGETAEVELAPQPARSGR